MKGGIIMLELYENIKKLRKQNGWSQEELAKKAGYTDRSSIAKIEKGQFDLPQSKIYLFAKIFGVTPSELMGNDGIIEEYLDEYPLLKAFYEMEKAGKPSVSTPEEILVRRLSNKVPLRFLHYISKLSPEGLEKLDSYLSDLVKLYSKDGNGGDGK